jgi:hypothetical protein
MKKLACLALLFGFLGLLLAACGGGGGGSTGGNSNPGVPSLTILNIKDGDLVKNGEVPVFVTTNAVRCELLVDNVVVVSDGIAPFDGLNFNSSILPTGAHTVAVKVYGADNGVTVASRTIQVDSVEIRRRALILLRTAAWGNAAFNNQLPGNEFVWRFDHSNLIVDFVLPVFPPELDWRPALQQALALWERYGIGVQFTFGPMNIVITAGQTGSETAIGMGPGGAIQWLQLYFTIGQVPTFGTIVSSISQVFFQDFSGGGYAVMANGYPTMEAAEAVQILYGELQPGSPIPAQ